MRYAGWVAALAAADPVVSNLSRHAQAMTVGLAMGLGRRQREGELQGLTLRSTGDNCMSGGMVLHEKATPWQRPSASHGKAAPEVPAGTPPQPQLQLAEALFDNEPEHPWELRFRAGDVLEVRQLQPAGLEGWWLCRHRELRAGADRDTDGSPQQGLAPNNRLRLLPHAKTPASSATKGSKPSGADYDVPRPALTEKKRASHGKGSSDTGADYDQPRPVAFAPDSPPSLRPLRTSAFYPASYIPPAPSTASAGSSSGSSRYSILTSSDLPSSASPSDRGRSSAEPLSSPSDYAPLAHGPALLSKEGDYDYVDYIDADSAEVEVEEHYARLPRRHPPRAVASTKPAAAKKRESFIKSARVYDVLPKQFRPVSFVEDTAAPRPTSEVHVTPDTLPIYEALNVTKQAAIRRISFMQSQVQTELSRLFSFVAAPQWRQVRQLAQRLPEVKVCCEYLITHLNGLIRFVLQALQTLLAASRAQPGLEEKLRGLIDAVYRGCASIREALAGMAGVQWTAGETAVHCLQRIVDAGQILAEDVRKMTAFVLGNAQLIFSDTEELKLQLRPLPRVPSKGLLDQEEASVVADNEYEDVDYGNVSMPVVPRSPALERRILNSYIAEVNEEVAAVSALISAFTARMFAERTVTSLDTITQAEQIAGHAAKLARLTDSLNRNLTSAATEPLRRKLAKTGSYITTACKRFHLELKGATNAPDQRHFNNVKASLDYLSELCLFLKNSTETEV
ncbi:enhancer of filamentation 1-like isoform X2 [Paramacrobiotus metropolitanus]|uniref:enhancer of filamentation 1-like isoform X2 n=1 Tax=Paramacrobiotus metropolitanus TaxID=2943436 RepID=UPI002445B765|nr:enhancer of filamentation 1-like isoform X2 [Paramacrobiotus metropolitanus]